MTLFQVDGRDDVTSFQPIFRSTKLMGVPTRLPQHSGVVNEGPFFYPWIHGSSCPTAVVPVEIDVAKFLAILNLNCQILVKYISN